MNREAAEKIVQAGTQINLKIGRLMDFVEDPDERKKFAKSTGSAIGIIYAEILRPIFKQYPSLEPPELRDSRSK